MNATIALTLVFTSVTAAADVYQKDVLCESIPEVTKLIEENKMKATTFAKTAEGMIVVYANDKRTVVFEYFKDKNLVCLIAAGDSIGKA